MEIDGSFYTVAQVIDMGDQSTLEAPARYLRAQKVVNTFPELASDLAPSRAGQAACPALSWTSTYTPSHGHCGKATHG